jgi:hypothetical protein
MVMERKYRDPRKQSDVDDPQWDHAGRVHDWRNHVGFGIKKIWHTFTPEQRMALAEDAKTRASDEHWD